MKLVISCEHGGNDIPAAYQKYVRHHQALLQTHQGYDPGTLHLFKKVKALSDTAMSNTISRLLIECNRSLHHPSLFSEISSGFSKSEKKHLIATVYLPYRNTIENAIGAFIKQQEIVLHISLHSFTPHLHGEERNNDIGLLYDSKNLGEKQLCALWKQQLQKQNPSLKIRYNYPYRGNADGFTTYLRKQFPSQYIGIELEINQKWAINNAFKEEIVKAIKNTINTLRVRDF